MEKLDLEGNPLGVKGVPPIVKSLKQNKNLNSFTFANCNLNEKSTMLLSQMLARNNNIYHLDLSNNKLGGAGIMQLLKGLARNKSIRFFDISNTSFSSKAAITIMKWLASSYQVRGLKLGGNTLGVNFGANIAKYLGSNTGIAILDLSDGNLGSKATTSICEVLKENRSLRQLILTGNPISKEGSANLAESLRFNSTIKKLGLGRTGIAKAGLIALGKTLQTNRVLLQIDLSGCKDMADVEVTAVWSETLKESVIEDLDVSSIPFGPSSLTTLFNGVNASTSMKKLCLNKIKLGKQGYEQLQKLLLVNERLVQLSVQDTACNAAMFEEFLQPLAKNTALRELDMRNNGKEIDRTNWTPVLNKRNIHFLVLV